MHFSATMSHLFTFSSTFLMMFFEAKKVTGLIKSNVFTFFGIAFLWNWNEN